MTIMASQLLYEIRQLLNQLIRFSDKKSPLDVNKMILRLLCYRTLHYIIIEPL